MSFWQRLFSFAKEEPAADAQETAVSLPAPVYPRVLLIIHAPRINGRSLHAHFRWQDPDKLTQQYMADVRHASYGYTNYQIVERIEVDGFPIKADGFSYTPASYLACWQKRSSFHQPDWADYPRLLAEFNVAQRINNDEIDEVWLFGFPYAGYYESMMAGPSSFWCNAPPLHERHCQRRFVVMGFNYERGVGEMLENLGHRTKSIMSHVYRHTRGANNLWERFTRYDKTHPNQAACGNVHFAPNSQHDYDWGNPAPVLSECDDWLDFPNLTGQRRRVTCRNWGNGDIRQYHLWWLRHLPHVAGQTNGIANNWWRYIIDPNQVP
ncbi:MAG: hypothetical protein AAF614_21055 [Chloroflexota bacterium]